MSRRTKRRRSKPVPRHGVGRAILLWSVLIVGLATTVWWVGRWSESGAVESLGAADSQNLGLGERTAIAAKPPRAPGAYDAEPVAAALALDPPSAAIAAGGGARVAVVIDDLGRSLDSVQRLHALGLPLTYAVLPYEVKTPEVVDLLERLQAEVIVHLPMQAKGGENPGPGALMPSMSAEEIRAATRAALERVPIATGVNNHMGSDFTELSSAVTPMMEVVAERGLFFLDSRTSPRTAGFRIARNLGVSSAQRSVFLDNEREVPAIRRQFDEALAVARRDGSAIAIGHPYAETLEVLEKSMPEAREAGYEFVPVSFLLERSSGDF